MSTGSKSRFSVNTIIDWCSRFYQEFSANAVRNTLFILLAVSLYSAFVQFGKPEKSKYLILGDGAGYYAYLPNMFFYNDWSFSYFNEIEKKYWNRDNPPYFLNGTGSGMVDKYFSGVAIVLIPFYLLAWLFSAVFGYDCDGYSHLFCLSVVIGSITYVLLGLKAMSSVLLRRFNQRSVALAVFCIYLGTNLFYYTIVRASYSHAFSFAFICFFIYALDKSFRNKSFLNYLLVAFTFGFIVLLRPANALVSLSVFFIAPNMKVLGEWLLVLFKKFYFIPALLLVCLIISIQSLFYYLQQGVWWVFAYGNEGFDFGNPEMVNVLFSYRAGFFVWSLTAIPAIAGLILFIRRNPFRGILAFCFFLLVVYITSCWWVWHYEGTYGMRPLVDYLPFILIALCVLFESVRRFIWIRRLVVSVMFVLTYIVQVQTLQQIRVILPWSHMTAEKYWYIFLETHPRYSFFLTDPEYPGLPDNSDLIHEQLWLNGVLHDISPGTSVFSYPGIGDSSIIGTRLPELSDTSNYYYDCTAKVRIEKLHRDQNLVVRLFRGDSLLRDELMSVMRPHYATGEWQSVRIAFVTESGVVPDSISIRLMNNEKKKVEVDSVGLKIWELP